MPNTCDVLPELDALPILDLPWQRVIKDPVECRTVELLAVLVGGPGQIEAANKLLSVYRGDTQRLYKAPAAELVSAAGIDNDAAVRIKAGLELGRRLFDPIDAAPTIHSANDAAALLQARMELLEHELMTVILLDTNNQVMDIVDVYRGAVNRCVIRISEVLKPAVQYQAAGIIAAHNHPSGSASASQDDLEITRALVEAGALLDISVLDHLIVGRGSHTSLRKNVPSIWQTRQSRRSEGAY